MAKYEFCPRYCLGDPEKDPDGCLGCRHLEDVKVDPPKKGTWSSLRGRFFKSVKIVGMNGGDIYIEEKVGDQPVVMTVSRDRVKIDK